MYHVRDADHTGTAHCVACIVVARLHARVRSSVLSVHRDVSLLRQLSRAFLPLIVAAAMSGEIRLR